jgi:hypothetical protein
MVKERIVDDAENGATLVYETERDADEWEAVYEIGCAV